MVEFSAPDDGARGWLQGFGGDTSNCAVAAARQGGRVGYVSAVGRDMFGDMLIEMWAGEGIATELVRRDDDAPTGVYFITRGRDGHAFSYLRSGSAASRLTPADVPRGAIGAAKVLHLSGISQAISPSAADAGFAAIDAARDAGVLVSYDTNLRLRLWPLARARAVIMAAVAEADIILPGLDDARQLTGLADPDAIADRLLGGRARVVALTLGRDGALVATPDRRELIPALAVEAVDASGAGDCFDGAFLVEYLRTADPFAAARYACVAAALSTCGRGAVAPIPRRADVQARLGKESGS
jgi:2-dehydro-3-deoxygluconokinase